MHHNTASSLTYTVDENAPAGVSETTAFGKPDGISAPVLSALDAICWVDLSNAVFGTSRSLQDWERAALNEFTWAELES